jgi:starch synthase
MIAQRYGAPPIARRTGGLRDTIDDGRTGFLFPDGSVASMLGAVDRAIAAWRTRGWDALRRRCMKLDHSWNASAQAYVALYEQTRGAHRG